MKKKCIGATIRTRQESLAYVGFFSTMCSTYLWGSWKPKTNFVFTPNSMHHIYSYLFNCDLQ